jgi:hypothetical protein
VTASEADRKRRLLNATTQDIVAETLMFEEMALATAAEIDLVVLAVSQSVGDTATSHRHEVVGVLLLSKES